MLDKNEYTSQLHSLLGGAEQCWDGYFKNVNPVTFDVCNPLQVCTYVLLNIKVLLVILHIAFSL